MGQPILHMIRDQHFWLHPNRAIYWEEEKILIVSDTHFGKTGHFRKSGIAIPQQIYKEDLQRFFSLASELKPDRIIVVGDFFHSTANEELNLFLKWKNDFKSLDMMLVKGNHDILSSNWYEQAEIDIVEGSYQMGSFRFEHDPTKQDLNNGNNDFIFSGHIHPGVLVKGLSKQSLRLPCFHFTLYQCILPAFSKFSGLAIVKPKKNDQVYAIAEDKIILLS